MESYRDFFGRVTNNEILPYQERYGRNPFSPTLLIVPTGLGKTDAVLLPWLYARKRGDAAAPSRLIIVLPRQNLTVQTAKNARRHVEAAGLKGEVRVLELMGGSEENKDDLGPKEPAIIVATQDLFFSRALNRGYARKAPRWPIDFALYNQDCLIVHDEIQLMDDALATSTQLAAFRKHFGTYGDAHSIWMSATVNTAWLQTVDFGELPAPIKLNEDDFRSAVVSKRTHASKKLAIAPEQCREPAGCAAFAVAQHRPGTRTLVIANTVARAREIFRSVRSGFAGVILLHSRFRPNDRKKAADFLLGDIPPEGQIVVATQVLEAGVDITARLLVTDIAPWGSLVQRFGRVNRRGEDADAEIWWVDQPAPSHAKQKNPFAPYNSGEIQRALEKIKDLTSGAPADLPPEDGPEPWTNVLRRADLLDLFDTTTDLSGNNLDVSRFIRATEEKDAYLAWRDLEGEAEPPASMNEIDDAELCPVSLDELEKFIMKKHPVYRWNFATEKWLEADREKLYAGMTVVTRTTEGGYTPTEGWSPESKVRVEPLASGKEETQGDSSDRKTFTYYRQTLFAHTTRVVEELDLLLTKHSLDVGHAEALRAAAEKHDWGKAHGVFQETLHRHDDSADVLAKQKSSGKHARKHFRHELGSALAMLASGSADLEAYLVAAHHGKIRMGIRSMPGETEEGTGARARGIQDGDHLPACELTRGVSVASIELSLAVMEFGAKGGSWTERMLRLRDEIGPFKLAYLEMLLRSADETASADPGLEAAVCTR